MRKGVKGEKELKEKYKYRAKRSKEKRS